MTQADRNAVSPPPPDRAGPAPEPIRPPEFIRAEIEQTRAELSETVSALAAKADVKARGREAIAELTDQVKHSAQTQVRRPALWMVIGAMIAAVGGLVWWRQRPRSQ